MLTGLLGYTSCAAAANGAATISAARSVVILLAIRTMLDLPFAERQGTARARLPRSRAPRDARSLGALERARAAERSRDGDAALLAALPATRHRRQRCTGLQPFGRDRRRQRRATARISD